MADSVFSVNMSAMTAQKKFMEVSGGDSFTIGENKITARYINHHKAAWYRIETPGGTVYTRHGQRTRGSATRTTNCVSSRRVRTFFINDGAIYIAEQLAESDAQRLGTFFLAAKA